MLLYHGSNVEAPQPKILVPTRALDFGPGFYVTTSRAQAERWSVLTTRRRQGNGTPTLSCFEFDESRSNDLSILSFTKPSGDWLRFVAQNRRDEYRGPRYDLVIGPVANDRTMAVIGDFMANNIDEQTALLLLRPQSLSDQYAFLSHRSLAPLHFLEAIRVEPTSR